MDDEFSTDEWNTEVKSVAEDIGFEVEQKESRSKLNLSGEDWFRFEEVFNSLSEINRQHTYCSINEDYLTVGCPWSEDREPEFISEEYEFSLQQLLEVSSETDMEPFEYDIVNGVLELHTNVNRVSGDSKDSILEDLFGLTTRFPLQIQTLGHSDSDDYEFVYKFIIHANADLNNIQMSFIKQLNKLDKLWLDCPICDKEQSVSFLSNFLNEFTCENCWTPIPYVESIEDRLDEFSNVSEIRSEFDKILQEGVEIDDDSYFNPVPDEPIIDYENVKLFDIKNQNSGSFLAVVDGRISFEYDLNLDEPLFNPDWGTGECTFCGTTNVDHSISARFVGEWGMKGMQKSICDKCGDDLENDVEEAISNCSPEVASHFL